MATLSGAALGGVALGGLAIGGVPLAIAGAALGGAALGMAGLTVAARGVARTATRRAAQQVAQRTAAQRSASLDGEPFIFDSGATDHVSPVRSDFKTFHLVTSTQVTGIGGASCNVVGQGTVDLLMPSGHKLSLSDVLYIPSANDRIISVLKVIRSAGYRGILDSDSWEITNRSNEVVASGPVGRNLYLSPPVSSPLSPCPVQRLSAIVLH